MPNQPTASEAAHSKAVREMFSGIALRYDLLNHLLSFNIDKRWRRRVRAQIQPILSNTNALVLDVACGTGDLTIELQTNSAATVIGSDFCRPMLAVANKKNNSLAKKIEYIEGDAMNLSFADVSFDAVTIAFGLRNLANFADGVAELRRVIKPGGTLAILEFSSPVVPGFRQLFNFYFANVLPRIGGAVSGSRGAYEYLPNSVRKFPDQKALAALMEIAGFENITYQNLTGGIAAIHTGIRI